MTRDFTWEGRVNRNLKVSVITPNGAVYDMVQQMTRVSRRIEPSQVILINGARKGAKLQIAEAVRSEVVAFLPGNRWRRSWWLPILRYRSM